MNKPPKVRSSPLTLSDYQRQAAETDLERESDDPITPLLGLAGEVGTLVSEFKKKRRPDDCAYTGFDEVVETEIGDVLWYLAALARRVDLDLGHVAETNLVKTHARWQGDSDAAPLEFDRDFPDAERLPRQFEAEFLTYRDDESGEIKSRMVIFGDQIGDPIDDNARYSDHYRFHDVFHLGYAAVLGWSPVLRSLLARKRKSVDVLDRAEDGARPRSVEEGVSALVFEMARPYNYFDGAAHIDGTILSAVKAVTAGLEVAICTPRDWERAILAGFAAWRDLRDASGGTVGIDLDQRTLTLVE